MSEPLRRIVHCPECQAYQCAECGTVLGGLQRLECPLPRNRSARVL
jgi:hypothetical protein